MITGGWDKDWFKAIHHKCYVLAVGHLQMFL